MAALKMYDAVTVANIPKDAPAVAGYVGGRFPTFPTLVKQFPDAHKLSIAVASNQDAECVDCEPGDVPPHLVPGWVKRQQKRGVQRPVVYASVSAMPGVLNELKANGIGRDQVRLWTAHYTFKPHLCSSKCWRGFNTTADATQWTDKSMGKSLDESLLTPTFFGPVPRPEPATDKRKVEVWRRHLQYAQGLLRITTLPAKLRTELQEYAKQLRGLIRKEKG